jgi:cold shock CspA family protein
MATGRIKTLVHLSQQTYLPNARLVPDHNDQGYGVIEDETGRDVYFPHTAVESRHGFDDLRRGQLVEYTLENAPYLRANFVRLVTIIPATIQRPAA